MDKKMLFVFNPHAGKAKIKPNLADIIDAMVEEAIQTREVVICESDI